MLVRLGLDNTVECRVSLLFVSVSKVRGRGRWFIYKYVNIRFVLMEVYIRGFWYIEEGVMKVLRKVGRLNGRVVF